jgi:Swi5-dependent recombination DNA repair protein 1
MSTPPAPKRRRVDPTGIHKPFVSPLKRSAPSNATNTPAPSRTQPTPNTPYTPYTPYTPRLSSNLKTSTPLRLTPQDPEIAQAQQVVRNLEAQIRGLRSENGILSQALQITTSTPQGSQQSSASTPQQQQQPRLIRLTHKWQKASQLAAEEVFESFAQQIKDNGGFTTFLAQQKQNTTSGFYNDDNREGKANETNEEDWRDEDGEMLTERGKRQRRGEIEEQVHEHERACEKEAEQREVEVEEEEEDLSLGTMLQVLNIDPEVVGWDIKTLAWK